MQKFTNQIVNPQQCPIQLYPQEWRNALEYTQNVILQDLEFVNCEFIGEGITTYRAPINRSEARNIRLQNCVVNSFFGSGAIFSDVVVDGLRTSRAPVILDGCALRRVVLKGKCGRFLFNRSLSCDDPERNAAFEASNTEIYNDLDWALDISSLNAVGLEIRGSIPARLIRRNPEVQFVITRTAALEGDWKHFEPFDAFETAVALFLDSRAEDNVFVAPRHAKNFKLQVEFFHRLKSAGLVT